MPKVPKRAKTLHKSKLYKRTFYELTPIAEQSHLESSNNLEDPSQRPNDTTIVDEKPSVISFFGLSIRQICIFSTMTVILFLLSVNLYWKFNPRTHIKTEHYTLPKDFRTTFPELTTIKGNTKEAFAIFLCPPKDPESGDPGYDDSLQTLVYRLNQVKGKRKDIIVFTCDNTPISQLNAIQKLGVILIPVQRINAKAKSKHERWDDLYTKFQFWELLGWETIAQLDADFVIMNDSWMDIFDEPAVKPVTHPPKGANPEEEIYGVPLKDLYPYVFASSYDTFKWEKGIELQQFNSGLFVFKPNLKHYEMFMNMVKDETAVYEIADQTILNIVYNKTGPMPWATYDSMYNFQPDFNGVRDNVKAYHWKAWKPNPKPNLEYYGEVPSIWRGQFEELKKNRFELSVLPQKPSIDVDFTSMTIKGLKLSSDEGLLYYLVTKDLSFQPSTLQIKERYMIENSNEKAHKISSSQEIGLKIEGLSNDTSYRVFYFAETANPSAPVTDVYQLEFQTRNEIKSDFGLMGLIGCFCLVLGLYVGMLAKFVKKNKEATDGL